MAEIVNLGRARKARARTEEATKAAENRVVHGRTAAEKERVQQEASRFRRTLDQARLDSGTDPTEG